MLNGNAIVGSRCGEIKIIHIIKFAVDRFSVNPIGGVGN